MQARWYRVVERAYTNHGASLAAYAATLLSDSATAWDVVHDVFRRLLAQTNGSGEPSVGLLMICVRNACLNQRRSSNRARHREARASREFTSIVNVGLVSHFRSDRVLGIVKRWLESLPPKQQRIVRLWGAGASYEAIAKALKIKPSTVHTNIKRAKAKLRELADIYRCEVK